MRTFQQIIHQLTDFWEKQGCIIHQGHDLEMGAGTFNPATFLRCLGPEPYQTAYVEPSRRPSDGRYGENPNRLQLFHQFQVIIKPSPSNILDLYKQSLEVIGIDLKKHDLRFVHDDWESPTLGAYGLGWEIWLDGMEITQLTYFQAVASLPLKPISIEITYGLERLCLYVQNKDSFFDLQWNKQYTFRDIIHENEVEWSAYNFTEASSDMWIRHFDDYEKEAKDLIEKGLPIPAYDFVIKASHAFNMLDARGVISVTERAGYIARIRDLSRLIAGAYVTKREKLGFPLLSKLPEKKEVQLPPLPEKFSPKRKETLLFEIGSEQLPATFVPIGIKGLEKAMEKLLKEHEIPFEKIEGFGTPQRLGVLVTSLAEGAKNAIIERRGPKAEVAYDESGKLTKQGAGFLRGLGEGAKVEERDGYLYAEVEKIGKSIYHVLSKHLPELIAQLEFPKKMRWGTLDVHYPRPIHWIVTLYGEQVIPFSFGEVVSGKVSRGHDQLSPGPITIDQANHYYAVMEKHQVLANVHQRRATILDQLAAIEAEHNGETLQKEVVLSQVLHLTEWPMLTAEHFDTAFLAAPPEVLISEMVEHQKYFPFADHKGNLQTLFIITADNTPNDTIRAGNKKVLSARLADGVFLYNQDRKKPLESFNEMLAKMTFQKDLGSMLDKVNRITRLVQMLNEMIGVADEQKLLRAALLCKADLASDMVGEFPELQGTIGKYYALDQNEDKEVAKAIEEHWMPRSEGGDLPSTPTGIVLALADKFDNLISYFSVGLKPTSSSDPFALRRQTIGLIKILIENAISIDMRKLVNDEILSYITARARSVLVDFGFAKDEVEASLSNQCIDPFDQFCKVEALHKFRKTDTFAKLFEVYKRAKGQLEKGTPGTIHPDLCTEPEEKALLTALNQLKKTWKGHLQDKDYVKAFEEMAKLQKPLADLFDHVKILSEDPAICTNRLSLLHSVFTHFSDLLDFSKL